MTRDTRVIVLAGVALALAWWATAQAETVTTTTTQPDTRTDSSSFGPIEPVGTAPYTGPSPRSAEEQASLCRLCKAAPTLGEGCKGVSWMTVPDPLWIGRTMTLDLRKTMTCPAA